MSGQKQPPKNPTSQHPHRDANSPAGLLAIAEETLAKFLGKATGAAVDWVQMIGMKPGPDSIGIVVVSRNCSGVAARACSLVSLEPTKVAKILKDRLSWFRDCCCHDVASAIPTGTGGTMELVYMQIFATSLEDGSLVVTNLKHLLVVNIGGRCLLHRVVNIGGSCLLHAHLASLSDDAYGLLTSFGLPPGQAKRLFFADHRLLLQARLEAPQLLS